MADEILSNSSPIPTRSGGHYTRTTPKLNPRKKPINKTQPRGESHLPTTSSGSSRGLSPSSSLRPMQLEKPSNEPPTSLQLSASETKNLDMENRHHTSNTGLQHQQLHPKAAREAVQQPKHATAAHPARPKAAQGGRATPRTTSTTTKIDSHVTEQPTTATTPSDHIEMKGQGINPPTTPPARRETHHPVQPQTMKPTVRQMDSRTLILRRRRGRENSSTWL